MLPNCLLKGSPKYDLLPSNSSGRCVETPQSGRRSFVRVLHYSNDTKACLYGEAVIFVKQTRIRSPFIFYRVVQQTNGSVSQLVISADFPRNFDMRVS